METPENNVPDDSPAEAEGSLDSDWEKADERSMDRMGQALDGLIQEQSSRSNERMNLTDEQLDI